MIFSKKIGMIIFMICLLAYCGKKDAPGESVSGTFFDDFSSYSAANPWTPEGGWHYSNGSWMSNVQITSGKTLKVAGNGWSVVYQNVNSNGYTLSAKIKPYTNSTNKPDFCGILTHFNYNGTYENNYNLVIYPNMGANNVVLYKFLDGTGYNLDYKTLAASSNWFTFTLKVSGNSITGSVTDGVSTVNLSYLDSSPLPNGRVGIYFNWDSTHIPDTEFDDFKLF